MGKQIPAEILSQIPESEYKTVLPDGRIIKRPLIAFKMCGYCQNFFTFEKNKLKTHEKHCPKKHMVLLKIKKKLRRVKKIKYSLK